MASWARGPGRNPCEHGRKSAWKMGSNTNFRADCTTRSRAVGMPRRRSVPPFLGIIRSRTGNGSNGRALSHFAARSAVPLPRRRSSGVPLQHLQYPRPDSIAVGPRLADVHLRTPDLAVRPLPSLGHVHGFPVLGLLRRPVPSPSLQPTVGLPAATLAGQRGGRLGGGSTFTMYRSAGSAPSSSPAGFATRTPQHSMRPPAPPTFPGVLGASRGEMARSGRKGRESQFRRPRGPGGRSPD